MHLQAGLKRLAHMSFLKIVSQVSVASKVVRREELGLPTVTIMGDTVQYVRRDRVR